MPSDGYQPKPLYSLAHDAGKREVIMREEYRGYPIHIDVGNGKVTCPGLGLSADNVNELKTLINAELKTETQKYTPVKALLVSYRTDKIIEVTITRPAERSYSTDKYVWIIGADKKRSKESLSDLYAFECKAQLEEILTRRLELEKLVSEQDNLKYKLPRAKFPVKSGE